MEAEPPKKKSLQRMQIDALLAEGLNKLECPQCGCKDFRVSQTWMIHGVRKRLRVCRHCQRPINTVEIAVEDE